MTNTFKRWFVDVEETVDTIKRTGFVEYEDAVILAKVSGVNRIFDRVEAVFIDL